MALRLTPASRRWLATLLIWLQLLLPLLGSLGGLMAPATASAQGLGGADMGEFCTMASMGGTVDQDGSPLPPTSSAVCPQCCACSHQPHHGSAVLPASAPGLAVARAPLCGRAGVDRPAPAHVSAPERHRAARAPPAPAASA